MINQLELTLSRYKLFWQYPVITEQSFYEQNKNDPKFLGIPWATIIDKRYDVNIIYKILKPLIRDGESYYTCCQHIHFRKLADLWKHLNITEVYASHKCIGEDSLGNITIHPCPLYAVGLENNPSGPASVGHGAAPRDIDVSFVGGYQPFYLTDIRKKIFTLPAPPPQTRGGVQVSELPNRTLRYVIQNTGEWHFESVVYSQHQNFNGDLNPIGKDTRNKRASQYMDVMKRSRFSLAPSGSGPNSIRFWEALGSGSIPVLLADTLELPPCPTTLPQWEDTILRIPEKDFSFDELDTAIARITPREEEIRRANCIDLYNYFKNNYKNQKHTTPKRVVVHYCCGSYEQGLIGGVPRYDYHIKLAFPERIFIMQKDPTLLQLCNHFKDQLIVITDNHLACDVPNNINTYLIHHGIAETHAEREPSWKGFWKDLCCDGQKKMLHYRDPYTTKIISISQFCTDEFKRIYGDVYTKFDIQKVLHTSELSEDKYKLMDEASSFNSHPIRVLGNWQGINKGAQIIEKLKATAAQAEDSNHYAFNKLNVFISKDSGIDDFNMRKQEIYLKNDVFLNLSLCEGFSYSALDALLCGLVVVSTDVGVFYKDVPDDCFVKIDWKRVNDIDYVKSKIDYGWQNRYVLSQKGREWYMNHCRLVDWKNKMRQIFNTVNQKFDD